MVRLLVGDAVDATCSLVVDEDCIRIDNCRLGSTPILLGDAIWNDDTNTLVATVIIISSIIVIADPLFFNAML